MPPPVPNSSAAGYLPPLNSVIDDAALIDVFQGVIAGITGIDGSLFFPRWQEEEPNLPAWGTDWGALGVTSRTADVFPANIHYPDNNGDLGHDIVVREEEINVMVSFYGPHAEGNGTRLREGLFVEQNRSALRHFGIALIEVTDFTHIPEFIKQRWLNRMDVTVRFRRQVIRAYAILDLVKAEGVITANRPLKDTSTIDNTTFDTANSS